MHRCCFDFPKLEDTGASVNTILHKRDSGVRMPKPLPVGRNPELDGIRDPFRKQGDYTRRSIPAGEGNGPTGAQLMFGRLNPAVSGTENTTIVKLVCNCERSPKVKTHELLEALEKAKQHITRRNMIRSHGVFQDIYIYIFLSFVL